MLNTNRSFSTKSKKSLIAFVCIGILRGYSLEAMQNGWSRNTSPAESPPTSSRGTGTYVSPSTPAIVKKFPEMRVPTVFEMLVTCGICQKNEENFDDEGFLWQCLACAEKKRCAEKSKDNNYSSDDQCNQSEQIENFLEGSYELDNDSFHKDYRCDRCQQMEILCESSFSWLHYGAKLGCVPSLDPLLLSWFADPDKLNIKMLVSLEPYTDLNQALNFSVEHKEELKKRVINEKIRLREMAQREMGISFYKLSLSYPLDVITEQQIRDDVQNIKDFIEYANSIKGNIVIIDDISADRTVVLFTCWLLSKGWDLTAALVQARKGRLEHRELHPYYKKLIESYTI